jgi:hypothetical protein
MGRRLAAVKLPCFLLIDLYFSMLAGVVIHSTCNVLDQKIWSQQRFTPNFFEGIGSKTWVQRFTKGGWKTGFLDKSMKRGGNDISMKIMDSLRQSWAITHLFGGYADIYAQPYDERVAPNIRIPVFLFEWQLGNRSNWSGRAQNLGCAQFLLMNIEVSLGSHWGEIEIPSFF